MNQVKTIVERGGDGLVIDVECHMSHGLPAIVIVGSANRAVDEARERVRSAFASSQLLLPRRRITINLAPADIPKDSTSFDLAIVAAILLASGQASASSLINTPVIGELGLDGQLRPVRGIIGKLLTGRAQGYKEFFIPSANTAQAELVPGLTLVPVANLQEFADELAGGQRLARYASGRRELPTTPAVTEVEIQDIVGQQRAKRALEIAAAGGHNLLLTGPPGTGKTMLAKALPAILPAPTPEEILSITHLHSLASYHFDQIITTRPFRAPHHSASILSIIGGGARPRPGEVSLSHHGVLFLDELPEFSRNTLEALRQPLEDLIITVARSKDSLTFPAQFMLVATANPCPCGNFGTALPCNCPPHLINRYQHKLSGPILDRIDLCIEVELVEHASLLQAPRGETSQQVQRRVTSARGRQRQRYKNSLNTNVTLTNRQLKQYCPLDADGTRLLNQAAQQLRLSARGYMRTIKVARTIADLDGQPNITTQHLSEALQYRQISPEA